VASRPLPFRRISTELGQEVKVDFDTGAWAIEDSGKSVNYNGLKGRV